MVERSNPSALANPPGYSHVGKDGNTVYVAGQVARNSNGETIAVGDLTPKLTRCSGMSKQPWSQ